MSEAEVGAAAVDAIEREYRERVVPWRGRLLLKATPAPLMRLLLERTGPEAPWVRRGYGLGPSEGT